MNELIETGLAKQINETWDSANQDARSAIIKYWLTGQMLNDAKDRLPHGQFQMWCAEHIRIKDAQIRKLKMLANRYSKNDLEAMTGVVTIDKLLGYSSSENQNSNGPRLVSIADIKIGPPYPGRRKREQWVIDTFEYDIDALPPITINQDNVLVDGWYRIRAHQQQGLTRIMANMVRTKDETQMIKMFVKLNVTPNHGLPMSVGDKESAMAELVRRKGLK